MQFNISCLHFTPKRHHQNGFARKIKIKIDCRKKRRSAQMDQTADDAMRNLLLTLRIYSRIKKRDAFEDVIIDGTVAAIHSS